MSKMMKGMIRDHYTSRFKDVDGGVFVRTQGLNSEKTYAFRAALHGRNLKYTVVRNAMARQAFREFGYTDEQIDVVLDGPVGLVWGKDEGSALNAARAIDEWKRENKDKVIQWVGAYMDGSTLDANDAKALKDAPTKEVARGMLAGALQAGVTQFMATVREPAMRLLYGLQAYHDKKEGAA
jgi:ribosomal protein L10